MESIFKRLKSMHQSIDENPGDAIIEAFNIDCDILEDEAERLHSKILRAAILVDGGSRESNIKAIDEGILQYRNLCSEIDSDQIRYNLANGLGFASQIHDPQKDWLEQRESTRFLRSEARQLYWLVSSNRNSDLELRTQSWTNLANLFRDSFRVWEAHDSWHSALQLDPKNGVAAASAARNLFWLCEQAGGSDFTWQEALNLANIAKLNNEQISRYAGTSAASTLAKLTENLGDPKIPRQQQNPYIYWVEKERLTLSPVAGHVDPNFEELDWLNLPEIYERDNKVGGRIPPIFAIFNMLKSDYLLARDLLWRSQDEEAWERTSDFADTLDYAMYGPDLSALILSHRCSLDLLDKIAVAANHFFKLGQNPSGIKFGSFWRINDKSRKLTQPVQKAIIDGAHALYGLVELAGDYVAIDGIYHVQKRHRDTGTHRFSVLHDMGHSGHWKSSAEIEHHNLADYQQDTLVALRVVRSAIQMLNLAILQYETAYGAQVNSPVYSNEVPSHNWIRRRRE